MPTSKKMPNFQALFHQFEMYQTQETSKHLTRCLAINARCGYWNGGIPPFGYESAGVRISEARTKKKLAVLPGEAQVVSLIYTLFLHGKGTAGPIGMKSIAVQLNAHGLYRRGQGWTAAKVRQILTDPTYMGKRIFGKHKPEAEKIIMEVPAIVDRSQFVEAQKRRLSISQ
jgi:site-specific DNA recombinase